MRRILPIIMISLITVSCSVKFFPLKQSYPKTYTEVFHKPYDEVWWKILTYVGARYQTDTVDKQKGLIVLKRINYTKEYSFVNTDGTPVVSDAYFYVGKYVDREVDPNRIIFPFRIYMGWRITVEEFTDGVYVTIGYVVNYFNYKDYTVRPEYVYHPLPEGVVASSGRFEKEFLEQIK
jgi:hypothetical protein